jgi:hypothetical protein
MRQSRRKTLAAVVAAAMQMKGVGVLALGRAMAGEVGAKHCIKRVWRFLRNESLECDEVSRALLDALMPARGPVVVLVDWTDLSPFQQLIFALPRDGRALPFLGRTAAKTGEGEMVRAEKDALATLASLAPPGRQLVLVADRGFGHTRWLHDVQNWGWGFVQRIAGPLTAELPDYYGPVAGLNIPRDGRVRDWGWGTLTDASPRRVRFISVFSEEAKEPWILVTNLDLPAPEVVRIYQRRMWIEAAFRDWKNRNWGLGLDACRLSRPERHDHLFVVLALAYVFLSAFGAAAETLEVDRLLKANTANERVLNLARLGNYFLQLAQCTIDFALEALVALPP